MKRVKIENLGDLLKLVEVVASIAKEEETYFIGTDDDGRHHRSVANLTRGVADMKEAPKRARQLMEYIMDGKNCCENPNHRTTPEHADDWVAITNVMSKLFGVLRAKHEEILSTTQGLLDMLMKKHDVMLSESASEVLLDLSAEVALFDGILAAHFDIVDEGKRTNMADLHIDRVVAQIKGHVAKRVTELEERISEHEAKIARRNDRSHLRAGQEDRQAGDDSEGPEGDAFEAGEKTAEDVQVRKH